MSAALANAPTSRCGCAECAPPLDPAASTDRDTVEVVGTSDLPGHLGHSGTAGQVHVPAGWST